MNQYRITFQGRKRGAIGLSGFCVAERAAETPEAAILALYDSTTNGSQAYEHISGARAEFLFVVGAGKATP